MCAWPTQSRNYCLFVVAQEYVAVLMAGLDFPRGLPIVAALGRLQWGYWRFEIDKNDRPRE